MAPKRSLPKVERRAPKPRSEAAMAERFESQTGFRPEQKPTAYKAYRSQQRDEPNDGPGRARTGRDEAPAPRGPRAAPRGPRPPRIGTKGLTKGLRSFAARNPRRVLLAEFLLVVVITITSRVSEGETPRPSDLLAPFVVYLVLSFAAEVGGSTAKFAAAFGGLVLLAVVMSNAGGIAKTISVATMGPQVGTAAARGESGFVTQEAGQGIGGGGGGSW